MTSPLTFPASADTQPCSRRRFLSTGVLGLTFGLTGAKALADFPGPNALQLGTPMPPAPAIAPPIVPPPAPTLEIPAGISPPMMLAAARQFVATCLDPQAASAIVDARPIPGPKPADFHSMFSSDYALVGRIPPVRTRFGYFLGVDNLLRTDSEAPPRPFKDLNYFEMRRLLHPTEVRQFRMPMVAGSPRLQPTPYDMQYFFRVAVECYFLPNPADFTVLYRRRFSNDVASYWGFFVALNPAPGRPPYFDLFIDNRPMM